MEELVRQRVSKWKVEVTVGLTLDQNHKKRISCCCLDRAANLESRRRSWRGEMARGGKGRIKAGFLGGTWET